MKYALAALGAGFLALTGLAAAAQESHLPPRTAKQAEEDQALLDFANSMGIGLKGPNNATAPSPPTPAPNSSPKPQASIAPTSASDAEAAHDRECLALFQKYSDEEDGILNRIDGDNQDSIAVGASTYCGAAQAGYRTMLRNNCPKALVDGARKQWDMGVEMLNKHNARNRSEYRCSR